MPCQFLQGHFLVFQNFLLDFIVAFVTTKLGQNTMGSSLLDVISKISHVNFFGTFPRSLYWLHSCVLRTDHPRHCGSSSQVVTWHSVCNSFMVPVHILSNLISIC